MKGLKNFEFQNIYYNVGEKGKTVKIFKWKCQHQKGLTLGILVDSLISYCYYFIAIQAVIMWKSVVIT